MGLKGSYSKFSREKERRVGILHHKIKASLNTKFLLSIGIIITLILAPAFYWLSKEQESHILTQVEKQAHILFQQLVLERKWIAKHGGVYVEKRPVSRAVLISKIPI